MERALRPAVRALEETEALTQRLARGAVGDMRNRLEDKERDQRLQAATIKRLLTSSAA